jgi:hypothetical protein
VGTDFILLLVFLIFFLFIFVIVIIASPTRCYSGLCISIGVNGRWGCLFVSGDLLLKLDLVLGLGSNVGHDCWASVRYVARGRIRCVQVALFGGAGSDSWIECCRALARLARQQRSRGAES